MTTTSTFNIQGSAFDIHFATARLNNIFAALNKFLPDDQ